MSQKYTVARLVVSGERFEVMVHPDRALDYKMRKQVIPSQLLVYEAIFKDVSKGEKASEEKLKKIFGTLDPSEIAKKILTDGELPLTSEQRHRLVTDKKKQIVAFISRNCADPKTGLPHPPVRIEAAMDQIRISIDPFKEAEEQAKEIIKNLRPVLPIKFEAASVEIRIPPQHASRAYGTLKSYGTIKKEQWLADGSLVAVVEMPIGVQGAFLEKLGNITRGAVESKLLK
jgi:ribosome maturation protein SDO1